MAKREKEYDPVRTLRRMRYFVVAVLLVVLAWLVASNVYVETRSSNAFDELYYSTLDARSDTALLRGPCEPRRPGFGLRRAQVRPSEQQGIGRRSRLQGLLEGQGFRVC